MGLSPIVIRTLAWLHQREAFQGRILTLGKQEVYGSEQDVLRILREEGIATPHKATRQVGHAAEQSFLFQHFSQAPVESLDVSDFEGADHICDLNQPLPESLKGRYGMVFDGGTLEHVFDIRQALQNVADLLEVGGRVIHYVPLNGQWNHGFFQFSPCFFLDYYAANQFESLQTWVVEPRREIWYGDMLCPARLYEIQERQMIRDLQSSGRLFLLVSARRSACSTTSIIPTQGYYTTEHQASPPTPVTSKLGGIKRFVPFRWKLHFLSLRNYWKTLSRKRPPWGLKWARDLNC